MILSPFLRMKNVEPFTDTSVHLGFHMNETAAATPVVSVIALCYNHERFVVECLESIRNQTFTDMELIILDDCSCDRSVAITETWIRDHRISCRFIKHTENRGICRSLNEALSHATGKYVALIATDDVWLPTKLEHQVGVMEQAPENVGVLYCNAVEMDEEGHTGAPILPARCRELNLKEMPQGDVHAALWNGNFIPAVGTLVRRSCYAKVGVYDEGLFYEDYDMWLRMSRHFHFQYSPAIVARYRIVHNSAAHGKKDRLYEAKSQIFQKFLAESSLDGALRPAIVKRQAEFHATWMFQKRSPERHWALWRAVQLSGSAKYTTMLLCSLIGLSFSQYQKVMSGITRLKNSLLRSTQRRWDLP